MTSDGQESLYVPGHWNIQYEYSAGEVGSHFLRSLRDDATILGRRCPDCKRVLAPPRDFCEQCFVDTDEWVEIGPSGQIESYTIVPHALGAGPEAPYALAYVQLDGADTAMVNELKRLDLSDPSAAAEKISIGTHVKATFLPAEERQARITDFYYEVG